MSDQPQLSSAYQSVKDKLRLTSRNGGIASGDLLCNAADSIDRLESELRRLREVEGLLLSLRDLVSETLKADAEEEAILGANAERAAQPDCPDIEHGISAEPWLNAVDKCNQCRNALGAATLIVFRKLDGAVCGCIEENDASITTCCTNACPVHGDPAWGKGDRDADR